MDQPLVNPYSAVMCYSPVHTDFAKKQTSYILRGRCTAMWYFGTIYTVNKTKTHLNQSTMITWHVD